MAKNSQEVDETTKEKSLTDAIASINKALIPDPDGVILVNMPMGRDMESHKMTYAKIPHKEIEIPPTEVVYYTGSVVMDKHSSHSVTLDVNGIREVIIFDRNYSYGKKRYHLCAWVPKRVLMAGILFEKKINARTRQPMPVMRKLPGTDTPRYQIIGAKETDYRDLRKVYERSWMRMGGQQEADDELSKFMYNSIEAIPQEGEISLNSAGK